MEWPPRRLPSFAGVASVKGSCAFLASGGHLLLFWRPSQKMQLCCRAPWRAPLLSKVFHMGLFTRASHMIFSELREEGEVLEFEFEL